MRVILSHAADTDGGNMMGTFCRLVSANRERSYCVRLAPGISTGYVCELVQAIDGRRSLLVTTPTVARLYTNEIASRLIESGVDVSMVILECSEQSKTLAEVERLCHECFRASMDRRSLLIGCGGGVCTDLVTMAAALTRRGLSYVRIPTTLIGLIDAGIGIKGAVNLPNKKSAMGVFCPPEHVLLDPAFLKTLPRELISDGLAEAIKIAVAIDPTLFEFLEQFSGEFLKCSSTADMNKLKELVFHSALRLLEQLENNLYEDKTYVRLLDFGHTFSPLVESMSDFQVSHGVAVAVDIALSSAVAFELDLLSLDDRNRILRSLRNAGLPIYSPLLTAENCVKALDEIEAHRGGHLNLVVPSGIGSVLFITEKRSLPSSVLQRALRFLDQAASELAFFVPVSSSIGQAARFD
jgi:2-epi-5-epi-valiolone synthase